MKRIDLENHFYSLEMLDAMASLDPPMYNKDTKVVHYMTDADLPLGFLYDAVTNYAGERIQAMDKNHIDVAVLSVSAGVELLPTEIQIDVARTVNDVLAEAIKDYPDRLLGTAVLPVNDPEAACAELERCVKELGFVAWYTSSNYGEHHPDEEQFLPIFKKAEELGVFVYLHPFSPNDPRFQGLGVSLPTAGLGFTVDTMVTLTRMVLKGVLDSCPNLRLLIGHLGESIPFLLERMDNRFGFAVDSKIASAMPRDPRIKNEHPFSYYFENGNILVTTSGNTSLAAFECSRIAIGTEHILFASDYPMEVLGDIVSFIDGLPISEEERQNIYGGNALKYLDSLAKAIK